MNFNKIPPAINFHYFSERNEALLASQSNDFTASLAACGGGVYRYRIDSQKWTQKSQVRLNLDGFAHCTDDSALSVSDRGALDIKFKGKTLLSSFSDREFGVLGKKWNLSLRYHESMNFYGLGEKNTGMEKSGQICKFWNTDALFDFGFTRVEKEATDPLYASVPYVLIEQEEGCVGILLNNPYPSFMNLGARETIANLLDAKEAAPPCISIGAYDGTPELYFIVGASVKEVTRTLQRLTGLTELPPLWALGYHQCRFGYRDLADLEALDRQFEALEIPCDGLWLDIDYMDSFKVFTVDKVGFANHGARIKRLQEKGRKIVPIIDPGVKHQPDFKVFQSGQAIDAFCKTPEGGIYSGFVWPGRTAFPDFSMSKVREWWAQQVRTFTEQFGFDGYWIDMNDPSTGSSDLEDMLFNNGQDNHDSYHNQYALGMQEATRAGLAQAIGDKRPFIISRSGFIGSQQFSAIWTGDNWSNYFHLRESIAMTLNLSLSGIPFNGPDVPGFAGEASPELAVDWHKAGFLFPFFRNHSANMSPRQEPWQFEAPYYGAMVHFIRLRYKLLPYLYNLFIEHTQTGDPYLRPLFYEFEQDREQLGQIGDQFLVGASILQAPIVHEGDNNREVYLPDAGWLDTGQGRWLKGGQVVPVKTQLRSTGLYIREGAMIPMQIGTPTTPEKDLTAIELHIFSKADTEGCFYYTYAFDDGATKDAPISQVKFETEVVRNKLHVRVLQSELKDSRLHVKFISYAGFEEICLEQSGTSTKLLRKESSFELNGIALPIQSTERVEIESDTLALGQTTSSTL